MIWTNFSLTCGNIDHANAWWFTRMWQWYNLPGATETTGCIAASWALLTGLTETQEIKGVDTHKNHIIGQKRDTEYTEIFTYKCVNVLLMTWNVELTYFAHTQRCPSFFEIALFVRTGSIRDLLLPDMTFKQAIHLNFDDSCKHRTRKKVLKKDKVVTKF